MAITNQLKTATMSLDLRIRLQETFPNWKLDERERTWLWVHLQPKGLEISASTFRTDEAWLQVIDFVRNERLLKHLEQEKATNILPEHCLEWIDKDGRQINWLLNELEKLFHEDKIRLPKLPVHLKKREKLIGLIDYLREEIERKQNILARLQRGWNQHIKNDTYYSWFLRGSEKKKIEIAWDWYQEKHPKVTRNASKFNNLYDFLYCLDTADIDLDARLFHITEIKKAFKLNQTKSNLEGKKQTNLALDEEVRYQLNDLAKNNKITMTLIVEKLIRHAYQNGMPKKLNDSED